MKRPIITDLKKLKKETAHVELLKALSIVHDLEDSLDLKKGVGLSANQIDIYAKVAIIRLPNCKIDLISPKIIEKEYPFRFIGEHCLSLPGLSIDTKRYDLLVIENGDGKRYVLKGLEAIVAQHEIDHLNGLTILDRKWRRRK